MKTNFFTGILLSGLTAIALFLLTSFTFNNNETSRENTPGTVTFTVSTLTAGGNYAPKHVLAIWVEKDGNFVKTRKAMANQRKQYLYKWAASSGYNVTDAITGPTLTGHQTHTIEWDCTDLNGNVVPDGNYTMIVEFTDKHAQGPYYEIEFNKGTEPVNITPPNQQYLLNMELTFTPEVVVVADFSANATEVCISEQVVFTDLSAGATSWNWNFGEGAQPANASTQGPHTVSYNTPGPKSVSLTVNSAINITKTDYVNIEPLTTAGFEYQQTGNEIQFSNISQHATAFAWDFGDGNTSQEENPQHLYTENGNYQVVLTALGNLCEDDIYSEEIVVNNVAVEDVAENDFTVFPNPTSGILIIQMNQSTSGSEISIHSTHGRQVYLSTISSSQNQHIINLNDFGIAKGVYFLKISTSETATFTKIIYN